MFAEPGRDELPSGGGSKGQNVVEFLTDIQPGTPASQYSRGDQTPAFSV